MSDKPKPNLQIYGDRAKLEAQAARGEILKLSLGDVVWFESITIDNWHAIKKPPKRKPPKDPNRVETRGRSRGKSYTRREIPVSIVLALKERGLSGSQVAEELFELGYGDVSRDYANRVTRGIVKTGNLGGRPRRS